MNDLEVIDIEQIIRNYLMLNLEIRQYSMDGCIEVCLYLNNKEISSCCINTDD